MGKLYKMKHLLIVSIAIASFAGMIHASEVNELVEKGQTGEMTLSEVENPEKCEVEQDKRIISENRGDSRDRAITAFTFLLAALTVMATLFGAFIGYMGYKSSKEYEKEVAKAEDAAKRAEAAAMEAEGFIKEIHKKGHEAIAVMKAKFSRTVQDITRTIKPEEGAPSEMKGKISQLVDKIERMYEAKNYQGSIDLVEAALLFDENNAQLWHLFAIVLSTERRFQEALEKVNTAISKDPNQGFFYDSRSYIKLCWRRELKGPTPSKREVVEDIRKAKELGFEIHESTKEELSYFLDYDEYNEFLGATKEEDGFGRE